MKKHYRICLLIGLFLTLSSLARAENWPQWRGPEFNGSSTETGLPDKLEEGSAMWAIELPGRGASTPIVFGDRVFVSVQGKDRKLVALCYDAKSGNEVWRKEMGMAGGAKGNNADWAGPSAICDGKNVWFYFSSGDLACFDIEGKQIWELNV